MDYYKSRFSYLIFKVYPSLHTYKERSASEHLPWLYSKVFPRPPSATVAKVIIKRWTNRNANGIQPTTVRPHNKLTQQVGQYLQWFLAK